MNKTKRRFCVSAFLRFCVVGRDGFTLAEMIVVSTLFLVVIGALMTALLSGQTSYLSADANVMVQEEGRRAFDTMVREVREAGPSTGPTQINWTGPAGSMRLNFQVARAYNAAGCPNAICWGSENADNEWVHYIVLADPTLPANNNLQLLRCVTGPGTRDVAIASTANCTGGFRVLANNANTLNFSSPVASVVAISLQIRYQNPRLPGGGQVTLPLSSRVRLRNT